MTSFIDVSFMREMGMIFGGYFGLALMLVAIAALFMAPFYLGEKLQQFCRFVAYQYNVRQQPSKAEILRQEIAELEAVKELLAHKARLQAEIETATINAKAKPANARAKVNADLVSIEAKSTAKTIRTVGAAIKEVTA